MHPGNTGNHLFGGCYMLYLPEIKHGWKSPPCMINEWYLKLWISTQQQHIFSLLYHLNSEFISHIIYINNIQCWQSNCKYCKCIGCYIQNLDGLLESFNIIYILVLLLYLYIIFAKILLINAATEKEKTAICDVFDGIQEVLNFALPLFAMDMET